MGGAIWTALVLKLLTRSIQFQFTYFLHKQVKIFGQYYNINYIDGEKRAYRTSEQLTDTHSRKNKQQEVPIIIIIIALLHLRIIATFYITVVTCTLTNSSRNNLEITNYLQDNPPNNKIFWNEQIPSAT
jgi:hypothetical protein